MDISKIKVLHEVKFKDYNNVEFIEEYITEYSNNNLKSTYKEEDIYCGMISLF